MSRKRKYRDISVGEQFGRWTVTGPTSKCGKARRCPCRCQCGNEGRPSVYLLINGDSQSCGCLRFEKMWAKATKHGLYKTRTYSIWRGMMSRCFSKKDKSYPRYGGRGIRVCKQFCDPKFFYGWAMSNGYADNLSIDRKDNDGHYSPSNCRWATFRQQNQNSRHNRLYSFQGETHCIAEWARRLKVGEKTLAYHLKRSRKEVAIEHYISRFRPNYLTA